MTGREGLVVDKDKAQWQPIEMLDSISALIRGMAAETKEQRGLFRQSEVSTLDTATMSRTRRAYGDRLELISLFREQLKRWRREPLSAAQSKMVDELRLLLEEDERLSREILGIVGYVALENRTDRPNQSRLGN